MSRIDFETLQFSNERMQSIMNRVHHLNAVEVPVLIEGTDGTGKTSLAKYIWHISGNATPTCIDAAETDFSKTDFQMGLIIENVDQLNLPEQRELLHRLALNNETGAKKVLFTSRQSLRSLVERGDFRTDLYHKISIVKLEIPSLRERKEDISALTDYFLDFSAALVGCDARLIKVDELAIRKLQNWSWPYNLNELENVIQRALALSDKKNIQAEDIQFDEKSAGRVSSWGPGMRLAEVEKKIILQTLEMTSQNRTRAAEILGISIRTLRNKLQEYRTMGEV